MNNLKNKVQLIGNVGQTPEIKTFENGKTMAKFSLATTEMYKNQNGEKVYDTHWHKLILWGKQASIAEMYVKKGSEIAIAGKITNRHYVTKEGVKKYATEIVVNEFLLLDKKKAA